MNAEFEKALMASYPRSQRFPEEHCCPRGAENCGTGKAVWTNDNTCSYCGSLHPDVLMERLEAGDVVVTPTDKDYKIYVKAKDGSAKFLQSYRGDACPKGPDPSKWVWSTRESSQTKFYFQHLSEAQRQRFVELLNAKKLSIDFPGRFYVLPFFIVPV